MKLAASLLAVFTVSGMGACTTVDLSQVAIEKPQIAEKPVQNVVERSSISLTSLFRKKGWSNNGPAEKTNKATRVLLGGLDQNGTEQNSLTIVMNRGQLEADIVEANAQILQTTKAAEVYLTISDETADLGTELSMLEKALLSARAAEDGFARAIDINFSDKAKQDFAILSGSVDRLKDITDAYGNRIRARIISRASANRS